MATQAEINKEIMHKFWAGLEEVFQGKGTDLSEFLADDVRWTIPAAFGGTTVGKEATIRRFVGGSKIFAPGDSTKVKIVSSVAGDDSAALHFTLETVIAGRPYENSYIGFFQLRDGRVYEATETFDTAYLLSFLKGL